MTQSIYFISDLHFGHDSLVKFRNEVQGTSFPDSSLMDEWLVDSWNSVVKKGRDIVWILGDVAWSNMALKNMARLTGQKRLILGNHDSQKMHVKEFLRYFTEIHGVIRKYGFVMSHTPMHPNELEYRNWKVNVHGHVHHIEKQKKMEEENPGKYINVNVDIIGPKPIHLDQLRSRIERMVKDNETL